MGKEEPDWHGHQQGNICGCLKVSLDGVGLETCFFLPVPRAHRSQSGAKNKAQKMEITRPSNGDLHLPIRKMDTKGSIYYLMTVLLVLKLSSEELTVKTCNV